MFDLSKQILLVITPHPDDEILGAGGLIKRVKDSGGKVYILFLTVGVTLDYTPTGISTGQERLKEIENVAKFMSYDDYRVVFPGDDYHLKLDRIPLKDIIREIESGKQISLETIKPTVVAMPYLSDYNQDHSAVSRAALAATRPLPEEIKSLQKIILGYESVPTADWWDPIPRHISVYVTLSDNDLETKIKAMEIYTSQVRRGAHPRALQSLKNLAYFRGQQTGVKAAEGYFSYRQAL
jgi:N-acetylglucosamine malate deacetylase 1